MTFLSPSPWSRDSQHVKIRLNERNLWVCQCKAASDLLPLHFALYIFVWRLLYLGRKELSVYAESAILRCHKFSHKVGDFFSLSHNLNTAKQWVSSFWGIDLGETKKLVGKSADGGGLTFALVQENNWFVDFQRISVMASTLQMKSILRFHLQMGNTKINVCCSFLRKAFLSRETGSKLGRRSSSPPPTSPRFSKVLDNYQFQRIFRWTAP